MQDLLTQLDRTLLERQPKLHATLQPGIAIGGTGNLAQWFAWHNGQSRDAKAMLKQTYQFASYEDGCQLVSHMRSTLWQHPLQGLVLGLFARRSFYSLPLLTDPAGDGYYYHQLRKTVFWKFEGEQDVVLPSFEAFIQLLLELAEQPHSSPAAFGESEWKLLEKHAFAK